MTNSADKSIPGKGAGSEEVMVLEVEVAFASATTCFLSRVDAVKKGQEVTAKTLKHPKPPNVEDSKSFLAKVRELRMIEEVVASESGVISPMDLLKVVSDALFKARMKFAVAGGFARSIHAAPRVTADVDVIIAAKDRQAAERVLVEEGFQKADTLDYQHPYRIITKFKYQGRELDLLDFPRHPEFVEFLMQTSVQRTLLGVSYNFLGLEGVIITKLCSYRFKDKADIIDLRKGSPNLDVVKEWCSKVSILDRFPFMTEKHEGEE